MNELFDEEFYLLYKMQQLATYSNMVFKVLEKYKIIEDELFKNIIGIIFGLLLVTGFVSLSIIFNLLTIGLLLYSIRLVMESKVSSTDNNDILNLTYMWISIIGMHYSYNFLWNMFNFFGGFIFVILLNFGYTFMLTKLINNLYNYSSNKVLNSFNMKEFELTNNENIFPDFLLSQINFIGKFYTVNSKIFDELILKRAAKLFSQSFELILGGSSLTKYLIQEGYKKLSELSDNIKTNKKED